MSASRSAGPATWMSTVRPLAAEVKRGYLFPYDSWAHRVAVHRFVQDIPMRASHPTRVVLDGIEAGLSLLAERKKTILWGGRDFCFNDHFLAHWTRVCPEAEVHRYDDAGHYVLEDAGEDIRRRIQTALG